MYVTEEEFRASPIVQATHSKIPDEDLENLLERASRYFDILCGVAPGYFEPPATGAVPAARTFYGDGTHYLSLDPYVAGSLDSTITVPSGYTAQEFTEREGYLIRSSNGILLDLHSYDGWLLNVPVTVTATWGFDDDTEAVKGAVIELAINLMRTTDPAEVNLTDLEGQPLREIAPPRVLRVARHYKRSGKVLIV